MFSLLISFLGSLISLIRSLFSGSRATDVRLPCNRCSSAVQQIFLRRAADFCERLAFWGFSVEKKRFFLPSSLFVAPFSLFLKNAYKDFRVEDLFLC